MAGDGAVVGVLAWLVGPEATLDRLTSVGRDVDVDVIDREVVEQVVRGEDYGDVLTGGDGDLDGVEGERSGAHRHPPCSLDHRCRLPVSSRSIVMGRSDGRPVLIGGR